MTEFTAEGLPLAIKSLLEVNHYTVAGPVSVHGAEIDLIATPASPFAPNLYIEATIEYVGNTKYGKDLTKLMMLPRFDPNGRGLIVSAVGFTKDVRERAKELPFLDLLTYTELASRFERFEPYLSYITGDSQVAVGLRSLADVYEEPKFDDARGVESATAALNNWKNNPKKGERWVVIVGDYGTGKTALTQVLQLRWINEYLQNRQSPIPFRIELRDFSRQFDAQGLLHKFMDTHHLGQLPIEFMWSLIRQGRIILILDGYDEMAQYMTARERRTCLEALASLSNEGARGILTSRPNYFSEAEELQVFEALYRQFESTYNLSSRLLNDRIAEEKAIDALLETYMLERFERKLKDLDVSQTEGLVKRILANDPTGCDVVLGLLRRLFTKTEDGVSSLSGKPVVITYLLQVVDGLKEKQAMAEASAISEWGVYDLIIGELMLRDFKRTPELLPEKRHQFLQALAVFLSARDHRSIDGNSFKELIRKELPDEVLRRSASTHSKEEAVEQLFADLRSSATLTRNERDGLSWQFSHNSLREFLLASMLLSRLEKQPSIDSSIPVTDAMRRFVASRPASDVKKLLQHITDAIASSTTGAGIYVELFWDALIDLQKGQPSPYSAALTALARGDLHFQRLSLHRLTLSKASMPLVAERLSFNSCELSLVDFSSAIMQGADFSNSILDSCSFLDADLSNASFRGVTMIDCTFVGAQVMGADFRGIGVTDISIIVEDPVSYSRPTHSGLSALGYFHFHGARVDDVPYYWIIKHHPKFRIVAKICSKLTEQRNRQRRGLVQRGVANEDPRLADALVTAFENKGWVAEADGRGLVGITEAGRDVIGPFVSEGPPRITEELRTVIEKLLQ